ncbi:hypothetical protein B0J12DRAFT_669545 [Macrophomina phaseolina]|uniref:Uncharacterized protein n=1 Tax=Macrophomina phaseolina TaxID=35725 RepID=A0ABQ8G921_9PEZI|nr:hypothetical protein B0J12DRAFT_669545 [Macrophomina phaseolina]
MPATSSPNHPAPEICENGAHVAWASSPVPLPLSFVLHASNLHHLHISPASTRSTVLALFLHSLRIPTRFASSALFTAGLKPSHCPSPPTNMRFAIRFACYGLLAAGLTSALPFEAVNDQRNGVRAPVKPRSYAVVNVDGSSGVEDPTRIDTPKDVEEIARRAPSKSYSVVNVDGGPTSTSTTEQISSVTLTETVSSDPTTVFTTNPTKTVVYTQDTTIVVTETQFPAPSVTQTVVYTTTIIASPSSPTTTKTESTTSTNTIGASNTTFIVPSLTSSPVISISVVTLPPVTVTATESDTTSYYDNGMWHTSYAIKTWPTVISA